MDIHDHLTHEHKAIQKAIADIRSLKSRAENDIATAVGTLKQLVQNHFRQEEVYYRVADGDKRFKDRGLIHQLRNDHAALLFGMESLEIRLRKKGPVATWWDYFESLMATLEPHMIHEEQHLFPEAERLLTEQEWKAIRDQLR